jgi:hypothetical protein
VQVVEGAAHRSGGARRGGGRSDRWYRHTAAVRSSGIAVGIAVAGLLLFGAPSGVAMASTGAVPAARPDTTAAPKASSAPKAGSSAGAATSKAAPGSSATKDPAKPDASSEQQTRDEAAAEQATADAAAEEQARAQAAAEARAARLAASGQRARASWEGHGRPDKLILVRPRSVDLVENGRLSRQVPRAGGALTLSTLDRFVPDDWLSVSDGTADLSAAIVLNPLTSLNLGGDVTTVKLAGGPDATDAASIYTGRGRLGLRGVTLTSSDADFGGPLPVGPGRPFVVVSRGGRFDATDSTVSDLGTVPTEQASRPGVTLGEGSAATIVRTQFLRNSIGLKADRTTGLRLEGVTVSDSAADGLVLRGDRGTTLAGVTADGNGGNGVLVTGPSSDRPITTVTASGNKLFGVALLGQNKARLANVATAKNAVGGLRVSWSTEVAISDFTASDEPIGVYTHVGSGQVTLDRVKITGARRGLQIEKTTRGLVMSGSLIERSSIAGVSVGGHEVLLRDVTVDDAATGVRVERGASEVTAEGLVLSGGKDGVVALSATKNVVLRNLLADGVGNDAVRTFSPDLQVIGGRISGSGTGIEAGAATTIKGTAITEVDQGVRARTGEVVRVDGIDVSAISAGINVAAGSNVVLVDSRVDALEAVRGQVQMQGGSNQLSLPPLNLLGAIGVPLILLALVLEQVQAFRQRGSAAGQRRVPPSLPAQA